MLIATLVFSEYVCVYLPQTFVLKCLWYLHVNEAVNQDQSLIKNLELQVKWPLSKEKILRKLKFDKSLSSTTTSFHAFGSNRNPLKTLQPLEKKLNNLMRYYHTKYWFSNYRRHSTYSRQYVTFGSSRSDSLLVPLQLFVSVRRLVTCKNKIIVLSSFFLEYLY